MYLLSKSQQDFFVDIVNSTLKVIQGGKGNRVAKTVFEKPEHYQDCVVLAEEQTYKSDFSQRHKSNLMEERQPF